MLRRYVAFLVYLCGMCVALDLWVGALYSDDRSSKYKAPGCERWAGKWCLEAYIPQHAPPVRFLV